MRSRSDVVMGIFGFLEVIIATRTMTTREGRGWKGMRGGEGKQARVFLGGGCLEDENLDLDLGFGVEI